MNRQTKTYQGLLTIEEFGKVSIAVHHVLNLLKDSEIKELYTAMEAARDGKLKRFILDIEWEDEKDST